MIYDPYTTTSMNNSVKKTPATPISITKMAHQECQPFNSYEDGIDDFDGPLWRDALDPVSTQLEAEGRLPELHPRTHVRRSSGSHSPIEKLLQEEERSNETIPAMWNSDQPRVPQRHHQRRPSLLSRLMSDCEVQHESQSHSTPRQGCDFCGYGGNEQHREGLPKTAPSVGEYFQVKRGSW